MPKQASFGTTLLVYNSSRTGESALGCLKYPQLTRATPRQRGRAEVPPRNCRCKAATPPTRPNRDHRRSAPPEHTCHQPQLYLCRFRNPPIFFSCLGFHCVARKKQVSTRTLASSTWGRASGSPTFTWPRTPAWRSRTASSWRSSAGSLASPTTERVYVFDVKITCGWVQAALTHDVLWV